MGVAIWRQSTTNCWTRGDADDASVNASVYEKRSLAARAVCSLIDGIWVEIFDTPCVYIVVCVDDARTVQLQGSGILYMSYNIPIYEP
jgi:hypothetical protein